MLHINKIKRAGGFSMAVALASLAFVGCQEEELVDEPFGVIDLHPLYTPLNIFTSNVAAERLGGVPAALTPTAGLVNGVSADYYDFGLNVGAVTTPQKIGSGTAMVNVPSYVRVYPMYFFFDSRGNPMFSTAVRDDRTNRWFMNGGDPTLSPNQADDADRGVPFSLRRKQLVRDGRRNTTAHQRPIIDFGPGGFSGGTGSDRANYAGVWEVVEVRVADDYKPDSIKSYSTLQEAISQGKAALNSTGKVINCPLVDERTSVQRSTADFNEPVPTVEYWYRRKLGTCLLVNGWRTLAKDGNPDELIRQGEERLQTFDTAEIEMQSALQVTKQLTVPAQRLIQPVVLGRTALEANSVRPPIDNLKPRKSEADPPGYSPIRYLVQWPIMQPAPPPETMPPTPPTPLMVPTRIPTDAAEKMAMEMSLTLIGVAAPPARNMPQIGSQVSCGPRMGMGASATCSNAGACPEGLECNSDTCMCDVRAVGYGELCAPAMARCRTSPANDADRAIAPNGYVCHPGPRGFCMPKCNSMMANVNCGLEGFECVARMGEMPVNSVCIRKCKVRESDQTNRDVCQAPANVKTEGDVDVTEGLRCQNLKAVEGCSFDDAMYPR
ncbi:MAG TPA: hypothetical protein VGG33_06480 [Polyangia bacterium]